MEQDFRQKIWLKLLKILAILNIFQIKLKQDNPKTNELYVI